jgi:transcriptional regulator NrdR family protein
MRCPVCEGNRLRRYDSKLVTEKKFTNYYKCNKCRSTFKTEEVLINVTRNTKTGVAKYATSQVYILYNRNKPIAEGSVEEIAHYRGWSVELVRSYINDKIFDNNGSWIGKKKNPA